MIKNNNDDDKNYNNIKFKMPLWSNRMGLSVLILVVMRVWPLKSYAQTQPFRCLKSFYKTLGKKFVPESFLRPVPSYKKGLWCKCFSVKYVKFLKTVFYGIPLGDCYCMSPYM